MLRLIAFVVALVLAGFHGPASAQQPAPEVPEEAQGLAMPGAASARCDESTVVASDDCSAVDTDRPETAVAIESTASTIPGHEGRRHRFETMQRRGRRLGYAAVGFFGTGALVVGVSFAAYPESSPHAPSFGVLMLAFVGTPLIGTALPLGIASGGLLGRSRRRLRLLAHVVPTAMVRPGEGAVLGVAGTF